MTEFGCHSLHQLQLDSPNSPSLSSGISLRSRWKKLSKCTEAVSGASKGPENSQRQKNLDSPRDRQLNPWSALLFLIIEPTFFYSVVSKEVLNDYSVTGRILSSGRAAAERASATDCSCTHFEHMSCSYWCSLLITSPSPVLEYRGKCT